MPNGPGVAKPTPFWIVALLIGGFFAITGTSIGLCVVGGSRGPAAIVTSGPACAESIFAGLNQVRQRRGLDFEVSREAVSELIEFSNALISYETGNVRHEATFRIEAQPSGDCELILFQEQAFAEGALSNRRRGRLASIELTGELAGCECAPRNHP